MRNANQAISLSEKFAQFDELWSPGTLHRPMCDEEVHVILVEPKSTLNTGDVTSERTRDAAWL